MYRTHPERLLARLVRVLVDRGIILRLEQILTFERLERHIPTCHRRIHPATFHSPAHLVSPLRFQGHSNTQKRRGRTSLQLISHLRPLVNPQRFNIPHLAYVLHIRHITHNPEDDGSLGHSFTWCETMRVPAMSLMRG